MNHGNARISQLTGLKVLALLGIFYWHSMPHVGLPDLGARLVELFFVISGFLVGLRHHGTFEASLSGGWRYVAPKVRLLYPVYLIGIGLGVLKVVLNGGWCFSADTILPIVWALTLQQAWIPSIATKYNGASWFISAWAFCMLCAPALQLLLDKARGVFGSARGSAALFASLFFVRVFLEICQIASPGIYLYSVHVTPFVRLLEFGLAYVSGVWFREHKDKLRLAGADFALEIVASVVVIACVVFFDGVLPRWAFVLIWVVFVSIFAGGGGPFSRLLSWRPLVICGKIEMEFFLLHNAIIGIVSVLFTTLALGGYKKIALASFLVTAALSLLCYRLFRGSKRKGLGKAKACGSGESR